MTTTDQTTVPESETPTRTDSTPETGTTSANGVTPGATTTEATQKEIADLKAALKKANDEAKSHRLKANELDKLKADIEAANLSDKERLEKRLADLQSQHDKANKAAQERILKYEVQLQAAAAGVNPKHLDKAARLLDTSEIEYDTSGQPTNVKALLDALLKDMPELLGKVTPSSGGATNPSRSQTSGMPTITHEYISSLLPDDYKVLSPEHKAAISRFQHEHPHRF